MLLRASSAASSVAGHLDDPCEAVRWVAAAAVGLLGKRRHNKALDARLAHESQPLIALELQRAKRSLRVYAPTRLRRNRVDVALVRAGLATARLREAGARAGSPAVLDARAKLRSMVDAARVIEDIEPIDLMLPLLQHDDHDVRARAAQVLSVLANHKVAGAFEDPTATPTELDKPARDWSTWIHLRARHGRHALLRSGFRAAGYAYEARDPNSLWELVRALNGADHHAHNAQRLLILLTRHDPPPRATKAAACKHWESWLRKRRSRFKMGVLQLGSVCR